MSVTKNDRVLVFVDHLSTAENYELVYMGLETAAVPIVDAELAPVYRKVVKLVGSQATESVFLQRLGELGADATVKAIDVIVVLHGVKDRVVFYNNTEAPAARLKYHLACLPVRRQLRLLYSCACYGATHADDFVAAGFDAASGSLGVNANGLVEFPAVADALADGRTHRQGIEAGSAGLEEQDAAIALATGLDDVNSEKKIFGDGNVTINSSPVFAGKAYFFKGGQYVRYDLREGKVDGGYPHASSQYWPEMSPKIDAAVLWPNDKIYFFKGTQYLGWNLSTDKADGAWRSISAGWGTFMSGGVDAAVNWPKNKVYFFKGRQYARWDVSTEKMDENYPQDIATRWPSFMADGVDAAINWGDDKAYFFKGDEYIRMTISQDRMDEGYPQKIGLRWPSFMAGGVDAAFLWLRTT